MLNSDTVFITVWRKKDGDEWQEAGVHPTHRHAEHAGKLLADATGLQTTVLIWVDSEFVCKTGREA
jgi:hypothetical protein